jgi:hypothetical protein
MYYYLGRSGGRRIIAGDHKVYLKLLTGTLDEVPYWNTDLSAERHGGIGCYRSARVHLQRIEYQRVMQATLAALITLIALIALVSLITLVPLRAA